MDSSKTLDELDPPAWDEPAFDSYVVTTCHRLRRKPVATFSVEDLRIMIGQRISLKILVPCALAVVEREPLAEGDHYPGDLLAGLLNLGAEYWKGLPETRNRIRALLDQIPSVPSELKAAVAAFRDGTVEQAVAADDPAAGKSG